jgi:hypothetical protein
MDDDDEDIYEDEQEVKIKFGKPFMTGDEPTTQDDMDMLMLPLDDSDEDDDDNSFARADN